jgi:hypothetical protein
MFHKQYITINISCLPWIGCTLTSNLDVVVSLPFMTSGFWATVDKYEAYRSKISAKVTTNM